MMKTYLLALLGFVLLAVPATAQVGQLGFPSRPYGFDQSHPAAGSGGTRYSIISGPTIGSINLIKPSGLPNNSTAPTSSKLSSSASVSAQSVEDDNDINNFLEGGSVDWLEFAGRKDQH